MPLPPAGYFTDPARTNGEAKQAQDDMLDTLLALPATVGDVTGPASSTADGLVLFSGTSGKAIKNSGYTITAAGAALLDDADAAEQRATLGLGTAATATLGIGAGQVPTSDQIPGLVTSGLPRGHIAGLALSNNATDAANDIDISAGKCRDAADTVDLVLSSTLTKRSDAAWAAGTGNGGMDTGTKPNGGTLHVFLIRKDADGSVDALFSVSATSPTMPSGYTANRRIGSLRTDESGNIMGFVQHGDEFWIKSPILDVNTTISTTATSLTLSVPSGVRVLARLNVYAEGSGGIVRTYIYPPDVADQAASHTAAPLASNGTIAGTGSVAFHSQATILTNTLSQVRCVQAGSGVLRIATVGWIDSRGREE